MTLLIDTSKNKIIKIGLIKNRKIISLVEVLSEFSQSEKLLPSIEALLKKEKVSKFDLKRIKIANAGEGFTSLRAGVSTANALGYALNIPVMKINEEKIKKADFNIVEPEYAREPNITLKKNKIVD